MALIYGGLNKRELLKQLLVDGPEERAFPWIAVIQNYGPDTLRGKTISKVSTCWAAPYNDHIVSSGKPFNAGTFKITQRRGIGLVRESCRICRSNHEDSFPAKVTKGLLLRGCKWFKNYAIGLGVKT